MEKHMISYFLSNISAKYYKNPSMLSRVIAKNVGDVFLRHSVVHRSRIRYLSKKIANFNEFSEIKKIRKNS